MPDTSFPFRFRALPAGLLFLFLAVPLPTAEPLAGQEQDTYERGIALKRQGDWQGALQIWEEGRRELAREDRYDPRIGVAYVETVAEELAFEHYETAGDVFLWGFSGTDLERYRETVAAEVARIKPILPPEDTAVWTRRLESGDPSVIREIKRFWIEKDPTPSTRLNERLLEHWERIAYARENFTLARNTPYRTDDRGLIYVKFGPPDKTQAGTMGASEFEMQIRIPDPLAREVMRRYETHPRYEVWAYNDLNPEDVTWYLFGNEDGSGPFRLLDSPWDMIPDEARSMSSRDQTIGGVRAAYFMELFYYGELARVGGPYLERFSELEILWDRAASGRQRSSGVPTEGMLENYSLRYRQEDEIGPRYPAVVPVLSEYEGVRRELELVVMPLRVLSEENEPQLVITALSAPRVRMTETRTVQDRGTSMAERTVNHTLIVRNEALEEVGRLTERVNSATGDISTFLLRHIDRELHYTVLAETDRDDSRVGVEDLIYPGQAHFVPEPSLDPDPSRLEVSDVVTGLEVPPGVNPQGLVFPLIPSRTIWQGDPLRIYLEVYHLALDEDDLARFRADFRVVPLDDRGRVDTSQTPVTLSVDLESAGRTSRRTFDLNVADQAVGDYRLEVLITDLVSGQSKTRTAPLEIIR